MSKSFQYPSEMDAERLEQILAAVENSWSSETTLDANWNETRPSSGQCAVSSLVIQDFLGGRLLRATVSGISHYWNLLPDGGEIDATRDQFETFEPLNVEERSREYVLSFPATAERYRSIRQSVDDYIRENTYETVEEK